MSEKEDIFKLLQNVDINNISFFDSMSAEQKKAVSPYMLMRWLVGTNDTKQILRVNNTLNQFIFSLQQEKDLLIKMCMVSSTGRKTYKWIPKLHKKKHTTKIEIISQAYGLSIKEAEIVEHLVDDADIQELAKELGYQNEDIKSLKK